MEPARASVIPRAGIRVDAGVLDTVDDVPLLDTLGGGVAATRVAKARAMRTLSCIFVWSTEH